ncbi:MAG: OmpA family protein, partial [Pedobacter sp.]
MTKLATLMLAATAAMAGSAYAQSAPPYAPVTTELKANTPYSAYVQDARGVIVRNSNGLCWRTGYWTPADAVPGCDAPLCVEPEKLENGKCVAPAAPVAAMPEAAPTPAAAVVAPV